jgi:hypothetical protein
MEAEQSHRSGTTEPSSSTNPMPPPDSTVRAPRWGLGAFLLVELVYVLVSLSFVPLFVHGKPLSASTLALAVVVPTLVAAGLAMLSRGCAATDPESTCGCNGRRGDSGSDCCSASADCSSRCPLR